MAMPCNDVHIANTNSVSFELVKESPYQTNDLDLCSPFCFCQCCQTLSLASIFNILSIHLLEMTLNIESKTTSFSSPVVSIWQPPKIN